MISVYSAVWAMINSSLMASVVMLLRRNTLFLMRYGTSSLVLLTTCCCLRMLTPFVIPAFQIVIYDGKFLPLIDRALEFSSRFFPVHGAIPSLFVAGTVFFILIYFSCIYAIGNRVVKNAVFAEEHIWDILHEIDPQCPAKVYVSPDILVPVTGGILRPMIFLADRYYDPSDLYYILLHEYTHWKRKDMYKKFFLHLVASIVWWNPVGYILLTEFNHILEIECDLTLIRKLGSAQEAEYMETLYKAEIFANAGLTRPIVHRPGPDTVSPACSKADAPRRQSSWKSPHSVLRQRFSLLLNSHEKGHRLMKILLICGVLLWMVSSYIFLPHPGLSIL